MLIRMKHGTPPGLGERALCPSSGGAEGIETAPPGLAGGILRRQFCRPPPAGCGQLSCVFLQRGGEGLGNS